MISVLKTMQYKKGCLLPVLRSIYKVCYRFTCKVFVIFIFYSQVLDTFVLSEICVQKVNELSQYHMIWTDEDGFLLKPLGMVKP